MTNLIVVLDPDYAERLEEVAEVAPVWIVATQTNRYACERLWKSHPHPDHRERVPLLVTKRPTQKTAWGVYWALFLNSKPTMEKSKRTNSYFRMASFWK